MEEAGLASYSAKDRYTVGHGEGYGGFFVPAARCPRSRVSHLPACGLGNSRRGLASSGFPCSHCSRPQAAWLTPSGVGKLPPGAGAAPAVGFRRPPPACGFGSGKPPPGPLAASRSRVSPPPLRVVPAFPATRPQAAWLTPSGVGNSRRGAGLPPQSGFLPACGFSPAISPLAI